jgi:hypothetical protein
MHKRQQERMEERRRWEEKRKKTIARNWIMGAISLLLIFIMGHMGLINR